MLFIRKTLMLERCPPPTACVYRTRIPGEAGVMIVHIVARLFDDVYPAMQKWVAEGIQINIYSSGSVEAQKLLFGHTAHGDLIPVRGGDRGLNSLACRASGRFDVLINRSSHAQLWFVQMINAHFDTKTGSKTEAESYKAIAKELRFGPEDILFVSDNIKGKTSAVTKMLQCRVLRMKEGY
jgi:enolase-phosphatase E1